MRFLKEDNQNPKRITKVIIEAKDLKVEGMGVAIQVEGYKGSPEEIDAVNNHVYIEKYESQTQIFVWNNTVDPETFKLTESKNAKNYFQFRITKKYRESIPSYRRKFVYCS